MLQIFSITRWLSPYYCPRAMLLQYVPYKKGQFAFHMKWQSGDCELAKISQNIAKNTGKWLDTKHNANGVERGGGSL